jgi:hypothetical protein
MIKYYMMGIEKGHAFAIFGSGHLNSYYERQPDYQNMTRYYISRGLEKK